MEWEKLYKKICLIRAFEQKLLGEYEKGNIDGTIHTCVGQELLPILLCDNLREKDYIFASHRSHGYFIMYSKNVELLLAEIMGKEGAVCDGISGAQHICYKHFFSNGIQGGIVPNAAGIAFAEKLNKKNSVTAVILGDGTMGQGVVYETFNMAKMLQLPILFVIEDNGIAMSTMKEDAVMGSLTTRAEAFGIVTYETYDFDITAASFSVEQAVNFVRFKQEPCCLVFHTRRLSSHSTKDDTRNKEFIERLYQEDAMMAVMQKVPDADAITSKIEEWLDFEFEQVLKRRKCDFPTKINGNIASKNESMLNSKHTEKYARILNEALKETVLRNKNIIMLGEDICDPYGGAFKITKGISPICKDQIYNMPISEAGYTGLAVGLCLGGKIPIVEFMFSDFAALAYDQILNHALKYPYLNCSLSMPLIIRLPSGGGKSYGATHSQSTEKYLASLPGITVLAPSLVHNPHIFWKAVIEYAKTPTVIVENKKMYSENMISVSSGCWNGWHIYETDDAFPIVRFSYIFGNEYAPITIITYGGSLSMCLEACERLMIEEELCVNIIVCMSLKPLNIMEILRLADDSETIITVEEGTEYMSWGSEVIAEFSIHSSKYHKYICYTAKGVIVPAGAENEKSSLPDVEGLIKLILNRDKEDEI